MCLLSQQLFRFHSLYGRRDDQGGGTGNEMIPHPSTQAEAIPPPTHPPTTSTNQGEGITKKRTRTSARQAAAAQAETATTTESTPAPQQEEEAAAAPATTKSEPVPPPAEEEEAESSKKAKTTSSSSNGASSSDVFVGPGTLLLKLSGLPWKSSITDVQTFLGEVGLGSGAVSNPPADIRILDETSGVAFVRVATVEDEAKALSTGSTARFGKRFVDITSATEEDLAAAEDAAAAAATAMQQAQQQQPEGTAVPADQPAAQAGGGGGGEQGVVRMRGLPYNATDSDILRFFQGFGVAQGGVHVHFDHTGRPSGQVPSVFVCVGV